LINQTDNKEDRKSECRILVRKPDEKRQPTPRRRRKDIIEMGVKQLAWKGGTGFVSLRRDKSGCRFWKKN
jgi:hypothetical protein